MTVRHVTRSILICDGCAAEFGDIAGFENTLTAHAEAYIKGWRFPNKVTPEGKLVASTSDACPACAESWTPVVDGRTLRGKR